MKVTFLLSLCASFVFAKEWEDNGVKIKVTKSIPFDKCVKVHRRDKLHLFYRLKLKDGREVHLNFDGKP